MGKKKKRFHYLSQTEPLSFVTTFEMLTDPHYMYFTHGSTHGSTTRIGSSLFTSGPI